MASNTKMPHPRPIALAHVVLRSTPSMYNQMVQFYKRLLAAESVYETPQMTFLRYDDEHHRIAILQTPHCSPKPRNQLIAEVDHIAFTYATLTALAQTYVSLKSGDDPIVPEWGVNHGPTTSLYYRDPEGNKIELQVDNFDTVEEADAFMRGPLFAMNHIGTDFDPEEFASYVLGKVGPDGQEGLSPDEVKKLKTRREIGERLEPPI